MADWFYISFADPQLPKGTQFLGGCYVLVEPDPAAEAKAMLFATKRRGDGTTLDEDELQIALAVARSHTLGINPGGKALVAGPIPIENMALIPENKRERLLTKDEIEA